MQEGSLGQGFYILAEGECRIYKQNQESISPNLSEGGRSIDQWEIFGETDVFYHTKRVWSCKCVRQGSVSPIESNALSPIAILVHFH